MHQGTEALMGSDTLRDHLTTEWQKLYIGVPCVIGQQVDLREDGWMM